jgi:hemerythrin
MVSIFLGRSGFKRRLREFNPCHDPKTGMFAPKGQGECGPGEWTDPGRQRSIYGNFIDDPHLNDLDPDEADRLGIAVDQIALSDSAGQKDRLASALGRHLEKSLTGEEIDRLYSMLDYRGLSTHMDEVHGKSSNNDGDENTGPDPKSDEVIEEYEEYEREAMEEADQQHYDYVRDEYDKFVEKATEVVRDYADKVLDVAEQIQAERREAGETDPRHSQTPLPEFDMREDAPVSLRALMDRALANHGGIYAFKDIRDDDEFDLDEKEEEIIREFLQTKSAFVRIVDDLKDTEDLKAVLVESGHDYFDGNKYKDGFEIYREREGGEPSYDIDSFSGWYSNKYGVDPDDWEGSSNSDGDSEGWREDYSRAYAAASFLLHTWAETSGDSNVVSVALQQAAENSFDLGPTFAGLFVKDKHGAHGGGESFVENTKEFYTKNKKGLDAFIKGMYENTQSFLDKHYKGDYVTLYRGMKFFEDSKDPGWESLSAHLYGHGEARGAMVDVLLQPISSFSTQYSTADGFTGRGGPVFAIRVPKSRILSTTASGFGAMNEHEVTVLGGRYPAFASPAGSVSNFWRIYKSYKRRGPVATDPFPGEAW